MFHHNAPSRKGTSYYNDIITYSIILPSWQCIVRLYHSSYCVITHASYILYIVVSCIPWYQSLVVTSPHQALVVSVERA